MNVIDESQNKTDKVLWKQLTAGEVFRTPAGGTGIRVSKGYIHYFNGKVFAYSETYIDFMVTRIPYRASLLIEGE